MCANDEFIPELMYALMTSIVDYIPEAVGDLKAAFGKQCTIKYDIPYKIVYLVNRIEYKGLPYLCVEVFLLSMYIRT